MKKIILGTSLTVVTIMALTRCGSSSSGGTGTTSLTTASKMTTGLGSSVTAIENIGGAMGTGAFQLIPLGRSVSTLSAATKCTSHAEPGTDANSDGSVSNSERLNTSDTNYALQKFYCTLATDTSSPEAVSGAVKMVKTVVCAIEKQLGSITFDGNPVALTSITMDLSCASQATIDDMSGTTGQSSAVLTISGGATVTASLNPTFSEIPSNTHYTHGIKIVSNDGTSLKYIILAKFDSSVAGDPVESGNFEFATLGTGTMMQGTAVEYTSGKIQNGTHLWYEMRANRVKSSAGDAICPAVSSSCGWARHVRLSTDITFSGGDVSNVSNFSGIITEGYDTTGSGQSAGGITAITATGSLSSGLTGQIYTLYGSGNSGSPANLTGSSTLADVSASPVKTCIMSSGTPVTTSCGSAPAALAPSSAVKAFILPPNTTAWFANASTKGGIGFSGAASLSDEQFVNP